jgi:hypothetical protein
VGALFSAFALLGPAIPVLKAAPQDADTDKQVNKAEKKRRKAM